MIKYVLYALIVMMSLSAGCKSVAKYPIDAPSMVNLDDHLVGRWKFAEDTNKRNFYEIIPRESPYPLNSYHLNFWDRNGTNPSYEVGIYISKIGDARFINLPYLGNLGNDERYAQRGFFFMKIIDTNADFTKMTLALVHDSTMYELSQAGVKQRIARNVNNPSFYYDTVHFYKVKG